MHEYRTRRRIEFADTDMGGIVHFARFFVFMEWAEHEMLRSLGVHPGSYVDGAGRRIAWPRVAASCDYLSPARFGVDLDIVLRVLRKGRASLTYGFDIRRGNIEVASGRVSVVYCWMDAPGGMKAVAIPREIAGRLEVAPDS